MGSVVEAKLPVLNFLDDTLNPGTESWELARKNVQRALEEYGCFEVLFDEISSEFRNKMFGSLQELFDLPTKRKYKTIMRNH